MKALRWPGIAFVILIALYGAYRYWERSWFEGLIPVSLELRGTVLIDGQSGGFEGCGVAIFLLSDSTLQRISSGGLGALAVARDARAHPDKRHLKWQEWKETPYVYTSDGRTSADNWLSGLRCASIGKKMSDDIGIALTAGGSYYTKSKLSGLIVIPRLQLLILSYFG